MKTVNLKINSCRQCPFIEYGPFQSTDGFDRGQDWVCRKTNAKIAGFVEWHEVAKIEIPKWCPMEEVDIKELE